LPTTTHNWEKEFIWKVVQCFVCLPK
jgi:hypothetical protein